MTSTPHYEPDSSITAHDKSSLNQDLCFFATAPEEIGRLLSAGSNLRKGYSHVAQSGQLMIVVLWSLGLLVPLGGLAVVFGFSDLSVGGFAIAGFVLAIAGSLRLGRVRPQVTFVGQNGIARGTLRRGYVCFDVLKFDDVSDFYVRETVNLVNGEDAGHTFWSAWCDSSGQERFTINGAYYRASDTTGMEDLYDFLCAARRWWNEIVEDRLEQAWTNTGEVVFQLAQLGTVVIRKESCELTLGKRVITIHRNNLDRADIVDGIMHFGCKGSGGVLGHDQYSFGLQYVSNLDILIRMLARHTGIDVQGSLRFAAC